MAYKRRQVWTGIEGIPPAPLIGEQLTSIDFDFMRTKSIISKEIPLLTMAELAEYGMDTTILLHLHMCYVY